MNNNKITLYSRNGIKIEKYKNLKPKKTAYSKSNLNTNGVSIGSYTKTIEHLAPEYIVRPSNKYGRGYVDVKKKSPLGFYYISREYHSNYNKTFTINASFKTITIDLTNEKYYLEYPTNYKGIGINNEMRPWDLLPGYKGIPDHFINDLYKELNKFFSIISDNGWKDKDDLLRKTTFHDIFGDERGPQVNNNNIKILSHGFDLKESFRKRKET